MSSMPSASASASSSASASASASVGASVDGHSPFTSVPEVSWQHIALFATPPDIYNLSLSSKTFFRGYWDTDESAGGSAASSKRAAKRLKTTGLTNKQTRSDDAGTQSLLASRLLRTSILSSLRRVLDHTKSGISLEALGELPEGSALIAGSAMAQACLGVLWENDYGRPSDVDIFCSAKAAPAVRSWLVEKAGCMFVGFNDGYIDIVDQRLLYTVDTKIHHVECWGSIVENYSELNGGKFSWYGKKRNKDSDADIDLETVRKSEFYKDRIEYGKNCQTTYVDWKWNHGMSFPMLGVDKNKIYNIKPKPRGHLPFDFDGTGNIDLVVARVKKGKEEITPHDLLDDFDLEICKASFDGKTIRIPEPHKTFKKMTSMEPQRRSIVASYVKHFTSPEAYLEPIDQSRFASAVIRSVRSEVPNGPFYRQLDFASSLPDRYTGAPWGAGSLVGDDIVQFKYGAPIQFHNWTWKLINRLRKYQQRGINVINAPAIADDFSMDKFSIMYHGG